MLFLFLVLVLLLMSTTTSVVFFVLVVPLIITLFLFLLFLVAAVPVFMLVLLVLLLLLFILTLGLHLLPWLFILYLFNHSRFFDFYFWFILVLHDGKMFVLLPFLIDFLLNNFQSDFEGFYLCSEFEETLMNFSFEMHLNSFLSVIDSLNCTTDLADLLVFYDCQQIVSHQIYFFTVLPESLNFLQASGRVIDLTILSKNGSLTHHLFDIFINREKPIQNLSRPFSGETGFVFNSRQIFLSFLLNFL